MSLNSERSIRRCEGPQPTVGGALPTVNRGCAWNAAVLNQRSSVRSLFGRIGSPTRLGRSLPLVGPTFAISVEFVTPHGLPDIQKVETLTCQPAIRLPMTPPRSRPQGSA